MRMSVRSLAVLALTLSAATTAVHAAGDPARGKTIGYTCLGCHGVVAYKNVYPTYSVPKLAGQHPEYLAAALKGYKTSQRSHATMHAQAASMSDQDIEDVAAYFAGTALKPTTGGTGTAPAALATCVSCHGKDGVGLTPDYPTLSGQYADYLERALEEYKKGARRNPIMLGFASTLKPEEMKALGEYYAKQRPQLETLPRRTSILSRK
ncbi:MAG: cytochrome c [Steroidobacteraceae bacterium]